MYSQRSPYGHPSIDRVLLLYNNEHPTRCACIEQVLYFAQSPLWTAILSVPPGVSFIACTLSSYTKMSNESWGNFLQFINLTFLSKI